MTATYIPTSQIANDPAGSILWLEKRESQSGKTTLEDIQDALTEYESNFNAGNISKAEILTLHRAFPDSPTYKQAAVGIQKMDMVDPLVIGGPASVEMIDREGHLITTNALNKAFKKFMDNQRTRNVMVLHSDVQVGWALPAYISKGGQIFKSGVGDNGLFFICELRDDTAIAKKVADQINQGMLKSYSIAGSATKIQNMKKGETPYMQVDEMELAEVTICEKGVNQGASFELLKAELPQTGKIDKDQCGYRDATAPEEKMGINCGHCKYFNAETRTCDVVVGDIMPGDYCRLFAPCEEKKPQAIVHRKIVIMRKDDTGQLDFTNSFLDWMEKAKKEEDPLKSGKSFATLNNFAGREAEHHRLLQEYGFPSEPSLDSMRYIPVVETETDDDGVPINIIPPWVVNEAGQDLGDKLDEDAPTFKKSIDIINEILQKAPKDRMDGPKRTDSLPNITRGFKPKRRANINRTPRGDIDAIMRQRAVQIGDPSKLDPKNPKLSVDKANGSTDYMPHVEGIKQGGAEAGGVDPKIAPKPRFQNPEIAAQPTAEFGRQMGVPQAGDTPPAGPSVWDRMKRQFGSAASAGRDVVGRGLDAAGQVAQGVKTDVDEARKTAQAKLGTLYQQGKGQAERARKYSQRKFGEGVHGVAEFGRGFREGAGSVTGYEEGKPVFDEIRSGGGKRDEKGRLRRTMGEGKGRFASRNKGLRRVGQLFGATGRGAAEGARAGASGIAEAAARGTAGFAQGLTERDLGDTLGERGRDPGWQGKIQRGARKLGGVTRMGGVQTGRTARGLGRGLAPGDFGRQLRDRGGDFEANRPPKERSAADRFGEWLGSQGRERTADVLDTTGQTARGFGRGVAPGQYGKRLRAEEAASGKDRTWGEKLGQIAGTGARGAGRWGANVSTRAGRETPRFGSKARENAHMMNNEGVGRGVEFNPQAHRNTSLREQHQMNTELVQRINEGRSLSPKEWMQAIHHMSQTNDGERTAVFRDIDISHADWNKPMSFEDMKGHIDRMNVSHGAHGSAGKRSLDALLNKIGNVHSGNDSSGLRLKPQDFEDKGERSDENWDGNEEDKKEEDKKTEEWNFAVMNSGNLQKSYNAKSNVTNTFKRAFKIGA